LIIRCRRNEAGQVQLDFEDTGVGIPKENMKYLFTPFFSTKSPREGTEVEVPPPPPPRRVPFLSYSQFESLYGEEGLEQERALWLRQRMAGGSIASEREAEWKAFRAAAENYVPEVRPGNQTALNAASAPFAEFLAAMHRLIHREFVDRYIASLGPDAPAGQNDPTLRTTLEIAVNPDGSLYRVGIVATSGNILFDHAAFSSVWRAQPFPPPPPIILSADGRAWIRWHFDRNPRHCGTWNAEPYILRNKPSSSPLSPSGKADNEPE
ncbi:MAG: TonB family protein, partial [Deltaproteobacteria bacterium]|nr:TonB family protein [Deltaproteobacteria bacterium]